MIGNRKDWGGNGRERRGRDGNGKEGDGWCKGRTEEMRKDWRCGPVVFIGATTMGTGVDKSPNFLVGGPAVYWSPPTFGHHFQYNA